MEIIATIDGAAEESVDCAGPRECAIFARKSANQTAHQRLGLAELAENSEQGGTNVLQTAEEMIRSEPDQIGQRQRLVVRGDNEVGMTWKTTTMPLRDGW